MEQLNNKIRLYYDPNSISNFNQYRIIHTAFEWNIDFDQHILHGHVKFNILRLDKNLYKQKSSSIILEELILDAHQLNIEKITYQSIILPFEINTNNDSLIIDFEPIPKDINLISITIYYSTSSNQCKALQWLTKEQTTDRQYPYMFSQYQTILARSLYPCQDTPVVCKKTWSKSLACIND